MGERERERERELLSTDQFERKVILSSPFSDCHFLLLFEITVPEMRHESLSLSLSLSPFSTVAVPDLDVGYKEDGVKVRKH